MPSLSIITAVLNRADTLENCLASVAKQTMPLQHILIDGASTDSTPEVIRAYADSENRRGDREIIWRSEPDNGIYHAMNKGIALASGDVIGILNGDDQYADATVLERVIQQLQQTSADTCYGDLDFVDAAGTGHVVRRWRSGAYRPGRFYWGWMPPHPTFFVRKTLYSRYGDFNTALGTAADYELMLRFLLKHGASTVRIPMVMIKMRNGGASTVSLKNRLLANRMDRKAWLVNGLKPYPWTLCLKPLRKLPQFVPF